MDFLVCQGDLVEVKFMNSAPTTAGITLPTTSDDRYDPMWHTGSLILKGSRELFQI